MRWRYSRYDPKRHGREQRFRHFEAIFNFLLVKTGGDVDEALNWLDHIGNRYGWWDDQYGIADFKADLLRNGTVAPTSGGPSLRLTAKGERAVRQGSLERVFSSLNAGSQGSHRTNAAGLVGDDLEETRAFTFGDPVENIEWNRSVQNALLRNAATGSLDQWTLREEDLEVREKEQQTGCATVLLIDVSHSMILYGEDRMLPAREVALALLELITTRYKKDTLDLVLFGDEAQHVPLHRIPYIQAGPYHTNTKAGLRLAQGLLRSRRHVNKQIFMITDGKPSCIHRDGQLYKNPFGLDDEIKNRTLDEALSCRRAGISVTTFMVARDPILVEFIEEFTALNRGRAYFTGTEGLTSTLFVDYLANRRTRI